MSYAELERRESLPARVAARYRRPTVLGVWLAIELRPYHRILGGILYLLAIISLGYMFHDHLPLTSLDHQTRMLHELAHALVVAFLVWDAPMMVAKMMHLRGKHLIGHSDWGDRPPTA